MTYLIVSATSFEIEPLLQHLDTNATKISFFEYKYRGHTIFPLVTGVGMTLTAFSMARFKESRSVDVAINLGLAGSFIKDLSIAQVVEVIQDRFGDLGIEESNGSFTDVHEMELLSGNKFPFADGWINNDKEHQHNLRKVRSITVNKVHGHEPSIQSIETKYRPHLETMEGASFMYACKAMDIDFMQIRAVSNYVESRNRESWQIGPAVQNLNNWCINYFDQLEEVF